MLVDLIDTYSISCLKTSAGTHLMHSGELSPLDLAFVSKDLALDCDWVVLEDSLGSDHFPCVTSLRENIVYESTSVERWCYASADWVAFRGDCCRLITDDFVDPLDPHEFLHPSVHSYW